MLMLHHLLELNIHCFWHQEDDVTLTSRGYMWTYPGKKLFYNSICVMPQKPLLEKNYLGICSDYVGVPER